MNFVAAETIRCLCMYEQPTGRSPRFWIISIHQFMSLRHFVLTVKSTLRQLWLTVYKTHPLCRAVIILKSDFSEDSKHTLKHRFGEKTSSSGLSHHNISAELGRFFLVSSLHKIQLNLFTLRLKRAVNFFSKLFGRHFAYCNTKKWRCLFY